MRVVKLYTDYAKAGAELQYHHKGCQAYPGNPYLLRPKSLSDNLVEAPRRVIGGSRRCGLAHNHTAYIQWLCDVLMPGG